MSRRLAGVWRCRCRTTHPRTVSRAGPCAQPSGRTVERAHRFADGTEPCIRDLEADRPREDSDGNSSGTERYQDLIEDICKRMTPVSIRHITRTRTFSSAATQDTASRFLRVSTNRRSAGTPAAGARAPADRTHRCPADVYGQTCSTRPHPVTNRPGRRSVNRRSLQEGSQRMRRITADGVLPAQELPYSASPVCLCHQLPLYPTRVDGRR